MLFWNSIYRSIIAAMHTQHSKNRTTIFFVFANAKRWANAWHTQRKRENIANHACTEENLNILDFQKYLEKKLNGTCGVVDAIWKMSNWNLLGWIWQGFIETLTFSFCLFFIRLTKIPFCQNGTTQKIDILILSSLFPRFEFKV